MENINAPEGYKYEVVDETTVRLVKIEETKETFYKFSSMGDKMKQWSTDKKHYELLFEESTGYVKVYRDVRFGHIVIGINHEE